MKVSLQWAQQLSSTDITSTGVQNIVAGIGEQLGAVEEVIDWGSRYTGVIVVKVLQCDKHPNADKLSVCIVDDGGITEGVSRNDEGFVQVVCGAPNVRKGLTVAWLPPGSTVPSSVGSDPFVLGARELRGIISNGMLASANELGISDDHNGILELPDDITAGTSFKQLFSLDDTVIDLENKMFTHRPDCFGVIGVARELAGIQNKQFVSPDWYITLPEFLSPNTLPLQIEVQTNLVPRLMAVAMDNVVVGPSPTWLQADLAKVGIKSINNVVDVTNWLMHTTAQPLHAYDYDKIVAVSGSETPLLRARMSKPGEQISLLNGKTLTLQDDSSVMITADDAVVGLGGVMGGSNTEVDGSTTRIIIECATFDMYNIRRTSMKYGLFTDAVTRFNKGQSPLQNSYVIAKALSMMQELAGGSQASPCLDYTDDSVQQLPDVSVTTEFINVRLGSSLSTSEIAQLLRNVEFGVDENGDALTITVPYWRRDIHIAEDIVEEVGRLYGYNKLPVTLPVRSALVTQKNEMTSFKQTLRSILNASGANEVLSYSFVHRNLIEAANQNIENAFALSNAISPDLQYYRLSITPSLLEKVHPNIKAGYSEFALFEIAKVHSKTAFSDNLPTEFQKLAFVFAADAKDAKKYEGEAYYQARAFLDELARNLGIAFTYTHSDSQDDDVAPYASQRRAEVALHGNPIGVIGEFSATTVKKLKLPSFCAGFEISIEEVLAAVKHVATTYKQLPKFPKVSQDITLSVPTTILCATVTHDIQQAIDSHSPEGTVTNVELVDIYKKEDAINYTYRLVISNYQRTMTAKEVNDLLDTASKELETSIGAHRI
jgi:phenylalanyl-tRNA synthetase beta chain